MKTIIVTAPDGTKIPVTAPDGASMDQIFGFAKQVLSQHAPPRQSRQLSGQPAGPKPGKLVSLAAGVGKGFGDTMLGGEQLVGKGLSAVGAKRAGQALQSDAERGIANLNQEIAPYQQANPISTGIGDFAGNVASLAIPAGDALKAKGAFDVAKSIGKGGALGALQGALTPAENDTNYWAAKAAQTGLGFLGGLAGGTAAHVIGKATALGLPAVASAVKSVFMGADPASMQGAAVRKILDRFDQDAAAGGVTAQTAMDLVKAAHANGKPMNLADFGGENVKGLAGNVARRPGPARAIIANALDTRDKGAAARLNADISKHLSDGEMQDTAKTLMTARSAAAAPLYEKAYAAGAVWNDALQALLTRPSVSKAWAKAREIAGDEGIELPKVFKTDESGKITGVTKIPDMQTWDYIKRGLDDVVQAQREPFTGKITTDAARATNTVRGELLAALDAANPDYAAARKAWSGPTQSLEALNEGKAALKLSPADIAQQYARLSPSDQQFYRLGMADDIRKRIAQTGISGNEARAAMKNEWAKLQLRPVFKSDDDFNSFVDAVTNEGKMFDTRQNILGNSMTAKRVAEDNSGDLDTAMHGLRGGLHLVGGNLLGALHHAIQFRKDVGLRNNPALNAEIARLLTDVDSDLFSGPGMEFLKRNAGPNARNYLGKLMASLPSYGASAGGVAGGYVGTNQTGNGSP